jgi:hypothetical protein
MKPMFNIFAAVLFTATISCNQTQKTDTVAVKKDTAYVFHDNQYNQAARYIAGLSQLEKNGYEGCEKKQVWMSYSHKVDSIWASYKTNRLDVMNKWYDTEFGKYRHQEKNVFYPFSGPDWLNIYTIYPNGNKYVLAGLELVGNEMHPQQLSENDLAKGLNGMQSGLKTLIERGYFITSYMGKDFYSTKFTGVLPVIYFFLARTDCKIIDQQFIGLDKDGAEHIIASGMKSEENKGYTRGVKITFVNPATNKPSTMYYYSGDVEDKAIAAGNTGYVNFVKKNFNQTNTFIKAASYLLHTPTFSTMKSIVLDKSSVILMDDSGLPLKAVNDGKWNLTYYGKYVGPTRDFPYIHESDRLTIYKKDTATIKSIPFGTGYKWKLNESNMLFCVKK